jgi:hypothetical protein
LEYCLDDVDLLAPFPHEVRVLPPIITLHIHFCSVDIQILIPEEVNICNLSPGVLSHSNFPAPVNSLQVKASAY